MRVGLCGMPGAASARFFGEINMTIALVLFFAATVLTFLVFSTGKNLTHDLWPAEAVFLFSMLYA